jgi:predicted PhzF superfamily epimerase YddE/YHI9
MKIGPFCPVDVFTDAPYLTEPLAFAALPRKRYAPDASLLRPVLLILGLDNSQLRASQVLDNGTVWLVLLVQHQPTMFALKPDPMALANLGIKVAVVSIEEAPTTSKLIARSNREARAFGARSVALSDAVATPVVHVRAFAEVQGRNADPANCSLTESLTEWLLADSLVPANCVVAQRTGLEEFVQIHIEACSDGQSWAGDASQSSINSTLFI